jgi:hypothetical protein
MSQPTNDNLAANLADWLADRGREAKDVMRDAEGCFVIIDGEDGLEKDYLPHDLDEIYELYG